MCDPNRIVAAFAAFVYFLIFPDDLTTLLSPVTTLLNLTNAVSPWLYALVGLGAILWFVERNWGRRQNPV
jgi:hypothetical protein